MKVKSISTPVAEQLTSMLYEMALFMDVLGENEFKIRAYRKAAEKIPEIKNELTEVAAGTKKVPGIGEGIRGIVSEFLNTGKVEAYQDLLKKIPAGFSEIAQIPGLGPKKAFKICSELGVQSMIELEYACRENRLLTLKGFGEAVQKKVLEGIEKLKNAVGRARIDQALSLAEEMKAKILSESTRSQINIVELQLTGALARSCEVVDSIDFLIHLQNETDLKKLSQILAKFSLSDSDQLEESVKVNEQNFIKITLTNQDNLRTVFWITLKKPPSDLTRLRLTVDSEFENKVKGKFEPFIEWAASWRESIWIDLKRKPTKDTYLRTLHGSVKGFFHCHTHESDGSNSLEEMVDAAEHAGFQYIGISDHSKSAFYARGLETERLRKQAKEIKELQKKYSIRIFHGVESDILADGGLDYPEDVLDSLDFVIGSIHSRFKMDEAAMTERLCKALANPRITFWGHPTGRLLLGRNEYPLDWERCLSAAHENKVVIELNANPHRLDIDWRKAPELEKKKLQLSINPDAHSVEGISDTLYGELMAEKAMFPHELIFNLKPVNEVEKILNERKKRV